LAVNMFVPMAVGLAAALAWLAIWECVLRAFGISFFFRRKTEDRASRRERIKRLGKLKYILVFGVFGSGPAFGLAVTMPDILKGDSHGSIYWIGELVMFAVLFGWLQAARTWGENFRDPVPFPPIYPPAR